MISTSSEEFAARLTERLPHLKRLWKPQLRLEELRLDSLDTVELLMVVDELYGVRLTAGDLGEVTTVGEFCSLVATRAAERAAVGAESNR